MTVTHTELGSNGSFQAKENDKVAGEMTYSWTGSDNITIDHTLVNPDFAGKGVGKKLLMSAVDFARSKRLKIIPLCPFVKSVFDKMENIRDVLFEE